MEEKQRFSKRSLKEISNKVEKHYDNFALDTVNDHCLRMSVFQEVYPWHYHKHTDELFIVLEGRLTIEIRDSETIILEPGDFIKIPANTIHRTSATVRTVNLCFEKNADDTTFVD